MNRRDRDELALAALLQDIGILGLPGGRSDVGEDLDSLLASLTEVLPETARLYETELMSPSLITGIIDQAREVLNTRTLMPGHGSRGRGMTGRGGSFE
jgi:hypothetical protein